MCAAAANKLNNELDNIFGLEKNIHCQGNVKVVLIYFISPIAAYMSVNQVSFGSDNGWSPVRCQAIIKTDAVLLSVGPL